VRLLPALEAVIVVLPAAVTESVVTRNVPSVEPAGIVTVGGTVARVVTELVRAIEAPPAGAAAFNATVPVTPNPPTTLVWDRASEASRGCTVRLAVRLAPAWLAVIVAV
jgi:hypothetical protein